MLLGVERVVGWSSGQRKRAEKYNPRNPRTKTTWGLKKKKGNIQPTVEQ
jgi:hypothetical protein